MNLNREIHLPAFVHRPRTVLGRAFALALAYEAVMVATAFALAPHLKVHSDGPLNVLGYAWEVLSVSPGVLLLDLFPRGTPDWQRFCFMVGVNVLAFTALAWRVLRGRRRTIRA